MVSFQILEEVRRDLGSDSTWYFVNINFYYQQPRHFLKQIRDLRKLKETHWKGNRIQFSIFQ